MKTQCIKTFLVYFFLAAFISTKVSGFHVLSHEDHDTTHCEFCELVSFHNSIPALDNNPDNSLTWDDLSFLSEKPIIEYGANYFTNDDVFELFSRPPPAQ